MRTESGATEDANRPLPEARTATPVESARVPSTENATLCLWMG